MHNRLPNPVYSLTIRVAGPARRGDGAAALRVGGGEGAARPARRSPRPRPRRRRPGGRRSRAGRRRSRAGHHHFDRSGTRHGVRISSVNDCSHVGPPFDPLFSTSTLLTQRGSWPLKKAPRDRFNDPYWTQRTEEEFVTSCSFVSETACQSSGRHSRL